MSQDFISALVSNEPADLYNILANSPYTPVIVTILIGFALFLGVFSVFRLMSRSRSVRVRPRHSVANKLSDILSS
jgi:hypothetical protein